MDNDLIRQTAFEDAAVSTHGERSDSEIIDMFFGRDERALSAASAKYGRYCSAVALNILGNRWDAEECVNDALLKAWESIPPANPDNLPGYLAKITKNISLNRYRSAHAEKRGGNVGEVCGELLECVADRTSSVERSYENKELITAINAFLGRLPSEKRDLFVLRYWYCMNVSEIATRVGMTENHAAVVLCRTRKKLMKYLEKRGF